MSEPADAHSETDKPQIDTPNADKDVESSKAIEAAKAEPAPAEPEKAAAEPEARKALATAASSPVNPFLAAASEHVETPTPPVAPRSLASRALDYSAHAAIIVGLIGFAWTVGDHVVNRPASDAKSDALPVVAAAAPEAPKTAKAEPSAPKRDEMAELRQSNQKMHDEIRALRSSLETLRNVVRRDTTPEQVRMLSAGLESMKGSLGTIRSETNSTIAQLSARIEKLQPGKMRDLSDRLVRLERDTDRSSTASIPHAESKAAPKPPVKPASFGNAGDMQKSASDDKPQVISGWSVREVYQGVALVENKRGGTMEVVPGVTIPGAGVVKSIERHGNGWTVTTSKGQFASATPAPVQRQAPRPQQQYGRGYGYGYGYGYGNPYRYGY